MLLRWCTKFPKGLWQCRTGRERKKGSDWFPVCSVKVDRYVTGWGGEWWSEQTFDWLLIAFSAEEGWREGCGCCLKVWETWWVLASVFGKKRGADSSQWGTGQAETGGNVALKAHSRFHHSNGRTISCCCVLPLAPLDFICFLLKASSTNFFQPEVSDLLKKS